MPFLFVLRNSGTEDNGDEVPAFVINCAMVMLYIFVFFFGSCAAWLQRKKGSAVVKVFYGSTVRLLHKLTRVVSALSIRLIEILPGGGEGRKQHNALAGHQAAAESMSAVQESWTVFKDRLSPGRASSLDPIII